MSVKVSALVYDSDVGPVHKRMVLLALADNANDAGYCKPGVEYLVGKTMVARSTVFRLLGELENEDGLLERAERRRPNGSRQSNAYRLNLEALAARRRVVSAREQDELEELFDSTTEEIPAAQSHGPAAGPCEAQPVDNSAHGPAAGPPHSPAAGLPPSRCGTTPVPLRDPLNQLQEPTTGPTTAGVASRGNHQTAPARDDGANPDSSAASGAAASPAATSTLDTRLADARERARRDHQSRLVDQASGPRAVAAGDAEARQCPMCRMRADGLGWQRVDPATGVPVPVVRSVPDTTSCDHRTSHDAVMRMVAATEEHDERLRAAAAATRPPVQPLDTRFHARGRALARTEWSRGTPDARDRARAELASRATGADPPATAAHTG